MGSLMKKAVWIFQVSLVSGCLLGAAESGAESPRSGPPPPSPASSAGPVAPTAPTNTADVRGVPIVSDDRHRLGPGDKLSFQILEDRDPPKSLVVTDSGELDVPYVGRVMAAGKTCKELAEQLKGLLEKDYYYRATVVIGLDQVSRMAGRVYIWGQVRNQGAVEIPVGENFTAGKAILRAGGFTDFANKKKVRLVRSHPDGSRETIELNMEDILERGKIEQDVTLRADDFLIVPARLINW
jgi:protein involved in polysaccharide export with SLBB domain